MRPMHMLVIGSLALTVAGCPKSNPATDAAPDCSVPFEWGHRIAGDFVPFQNGDEAEITLGFQGFRYILSTAVVGDTNADMASFVFQIEVDGHPSYNQTGRDTPMVVGSDGKYVDDLLVFFNDIPLPEILGRDVTIVASATAGGCRGVDSVSLKLVDNDDCIDQQDGGVGCSSTDAGL